VLRMEVTDLLQGAGGDEKHSSLGQTVGRRVRPVTGPLNGFFVAGVVRAGVVGPGSDTVKYCVLARGVLTPASWLVDSGSKLHAVHSASRGLHSGGPSQIRIHMHTLGADAGAYDAVLEPRT
jgi:hypothetical protein